MATLLEAAKDGLDKAVAAINERGKREGVPVSEVLKIAEVNAVMAQAEQLQRIAVALEKLAAK